MSSNEMVVGGDRCSPLSAVIDGLAARDLTASAVSCLADDLVDLHRQLARLQGQITRRVAALDSFTAGQVEGHVTTAS